MGEPPVGIEPTTPSLPWRCSATELQGRRGYVPRRVNDSQGLRCAASGPLAFATSTVPSADADPTRRAGRRRGHPRHLQRRGAREHEYLRHGAPHPRRAGGLDPRAQRGPSRPRRHRAARIRASRVGSGPTARSSWASGRSRPFASARAIRPRPRIPSTSTGTSGARGWARLSSPSSLSWPPPTAFTRSSPGSPGTTRPPSGCTRRPGSSWSGSSARWVASTANGSTWSSSSACL